MPLRLLVSAIITFSTIKVILQLRAPWLIYSEKQFKSLIQIDLPRVPSVTPLRGSRHKKFPHFWSHARNLKAYSNLKFSGVWFLIQLMKEIWSKSENFGWKKGINTT